MEDRVCNVRLLPEIGIHIGNVPSARNSILSDSVNLEMHRHLQIICILRTFYFFSLFQLNGDGVRNGIDHG